jgi:hypothetical protein
MRRYQKCHDGYLFRLDLIASPRVQPRIVSILPHALRVLNGGVKVVFLRIMSIPLPPMTL